MNDPYYKYFINEFYYFFPTVTPSTKPDNLYCLNSTRMIAIIGVLLGVLLISLVVTICMCVRARELRRRLVQRQSFPYGRVHEYSWQFPQSVPGEETKRFHEDIKTYRPPPRSTVMKSKTVINCGKEIAV